MWRGPAKQILSTQLCLDKRIQVLTQLQVWKKDWQNWPKLSLNKQNTTQWNKLNFNKSDLRVCPDVFHLSVLWLYPRRHPATSCMKYLCRKRSLLVYTSSNLKTPILKHAWTSSRIIWSTQKPKISKPQVEGRTSSRSLLRGNSDWSEYQLCLCWGEPFRYVYRTNNTLCAHSVLTVC